MMRMDNVVTSTGGDEYSDYARSYLAIADEINGNDYKLGYGTCYGYSNGRYEEDGYGYGNGKGNDYFPTFSCSHELETCFGFGSYDDWWEYFIRKNR
jgi:hypothetical protein